MNSVSLRLSGSLRSAALLLCLAVSLALIPAPASASAGDAERALERVEAALSGSGGQASTNAAGAGSGRELTLLLRDLALKADQLGPADRRRADRILSRPSEGGDPDSFGAEAEASPICDSHFCVHWGNRADARPPQADSGGLAGVPDFVESVLEAGQTSYAVENSSLGWRDALSDGNRGARQGRGGGGQVDVYLAGLERGLFGYATTDPGPVPRSTPAYLVIDNDYQGFSGEPLSLMRVTFAHEYNHILQFGYDSRTDGWLFESTATWVEDQVYPEIDDYLNFIPAFARRPATPLAERDRTAVKLYGSAMWNHWLSARYGAEVIRNTWEQVPAVSPADFAVAAYEASIGAAGGESFSYEFGLFAAATAEWNATAVFPDEGRYPDVERSGRLRKRKVLRLDHTGYELFRLKARGTGRLRMTAPRGTRSMIALVGRRGPKTGDGSGAGVVVASAYAGRGGKAAVRLADLGSYGRLTAVVVNADGRVRGASRDYRRDGERYRIAFKRGR